MAQTNPRVAERRAAAKNLSNPPFDQRILTLPGIAGVANLQRGKIVSQPNPNLPGKSVTGANWTVNFLYNPSTISLTHQIAYNALPPGQEPKDDVSQFQGQTNSSVTFSLLFDRTYETWDKAYASKPAGKYGVYADIRAIYGMLNMVKQTAIQDLDLIAAPMQVVPCQVYFGGAGSLTYYGRIESLDVQYTHWTTKMIPNRAVAGVTMTIWPKIAPQQALANATAAANKPSGHRTVPHGAVL